MSISPDSFADYPIYAITDISMDVKTVTIVFMEIR